MTFGEALFKVREQMKISQRRLAKDLGCAQSLISEYEAGTLKNPSLSLVKLVNEYCKAHKLKGIELL